MKNQELAVLKKVRSILPGNFVAEYPAVDKDGRPINASNKNAKKWCLIGVFSHRELNSTNHREVEAVRDAYINLVNMIGKPFHYKCILGNITEQEALGYLDQRIAELEA